MMKSLTLLFLLSVCWNTFAQYPFEKYPALRLKSYYNWKVSDGEKIVDNTSTIPDFFANGDELTIQLTSDKSNWSENSRIRIFQNKKLISNFSEDIAFNPTALDSLRIGDFNNDGLQDIKIVYPYMSNGLGLSCRVIYLLQKPDHSFGRISFDDMMDFGNDRRERDFDNDWKYEVITMGLKSYKGHSYWMFNLYDIAGYKIVNVNRKADYPIMIQFLNKETFEITKNLTRQKMKAFAMKHPQSYRGE